MSQEKPSLVSETEKCIHRHSPYTCDWCSSSEAMLKSKEEAMRSGLLCEGEVELTERESAIINTLDWNLAGPGEETGEAGYFSTGPLSDSKREGVIAWKIVEGFERGGAEVQILSADDLLIDSSAQDLVRRVISIGDTHGVRTADGKPRVIVVTGFLKSKHITDNGVRLAIERIQQNQFEKKNLELILQSQDKEKAMAATVASRDTESSWALLLAMRYAALSSWQSVAKRKNSRHDTICLVTVAPDEIFYLVNIFQTGNSGDWSDMVQRWREGIFSPPKRIII